jgi:hypothetical protein
MAVAAYDVDPTDEHRLGIANALAPYADVVDIAEDDELEPLAAVATSSSVTVIEAGGLAIVDPDDGAEIDRRERFEWEPANTVVRVVVGGHERIAAVIGRSDSIRVAVVSL